MTFSVRQAVLTPNDTYQRRYIQFMRMVHEWRHLRQLKRAGRGHDEGGAAATKEGACAVKCPACPWPGINLLKKERLLADLYVICLSPQRTS